MRLKMHHYNLCIVAILALVSGCAVTPPQFPYDTSETTRARYNTAARKVQEILNKNNFQSRRIILSLSSSSRYWMPPALQVAAEQFKSVLGNTTQVEMYAADATPVDNLFSHLNLSHGATISAYTKISELTRNQKTSVVVFDAGSLAQCMESIRFSSRYNGLKLDIEAVFAVNISPDIINKYNNTATRIVALGV